MNLLKEQKRFTFTYGDTPFEELNFQISQTETDNSLMTVYTFEDGLKITNIATKHGEGYEWVNWLENTSDCPTQIISNLWDAYVTLPLPHEEKLQWTAFQPEFDEVTTVYAPAGSTWCFDEFASFPDRSADNRYDGHLSPGKSKHYASYGGRSSNKRAPFFNVHKDNMGYIFAIGWTGQWNSSITRQEDKLLFRSKIENTHFRLYPGEKFRTSSIVIMPYKGTVAESQNQWRRYVKKYFSPFTAATAGNHSVTSGPLCASIWGGMRSASIIDRIHTIQQNNLPFEYIWVDAGWYGIDTQPTPDEFEGDWPQHTGDWRISPLIHPDGLKDVSNAAHDAGMKFLLWFEPEHVRPNIPAAIEHPEYFLTHPTNDDLLLNLGDSNAWNYCYETIAGMIEEIGIDCYRQDFNTDPLDYWLKNDAADRKGISEIKHINGLYKLWDTLLDRFPSLLIDNCASGGRRIDIETLRRSIPLWRSDFQCTANYLIEGAQCHHMSFNHWMPYSGTGSGRSYDTYRMRSAYSPALSCAHTFSDREAFGTDPKKMTWLKNILEEYLKVRPLMNGDFYPLTEISDRTDVWAASQFDRPEEGDGMIQIFRREKSPYKTAALQLFAVDKKCDYCIIDADDNSEFVISGAALEESGFEVTIPQKRTAKIYFYHKISSI